MAEVKINRKKYCDCQFNDLTVGDIFSYGDEIFLTVDDCHNASHLDPENFGSMRWFDGDEYVHVFKNAEIIVNLKE